VSKSPNAYAFAAVAGRALSACSDGYSGKNDTLHLAYGMSQQATLDAMNQLGDGRQLPTRFQFALLDGCILEIQASGGLQRNVTQTVPLNGTEATLEKNPDSESYRVQMAYTSADSPGHTALEGADWIDATQMKWLLDYVRTFC
jgi:hypothetical protein